MFPKWHIILGFIFSGLLYYLFPQIGILEASIIFLASFLIDVDHYIYYVFLKKDFSLKRAYNWFVENIKKYPLIQKKERESILFAICIFHTIESLILILFLSYLFHPFIFVFIGFLFHRILDDLNAIYDHGLHHDFSLIYKLLKLKKLEKVRYLE